MNIVHIYIRIYSAYVLVNTKHTHGHIHTEANDFSSPEIYIHTKSTQFNRRSLVAKVLTFWDDF